MPSPYFINVDPSPHKLRMFFGRRQEIRAIHDHLMNGDSVLLIGERRTGKTFLLQMIGDLAGRGTALCEQLMDRETGALLTELRNTNASVRWPYVDMLTVSNSSGFYLHVLAGLDQGHAERFMNLWPIEHVIFTKELAKLSGELASKGQRAVVLVDESEKLLSLEDSAQVLSCLKASIQQCDCIDFVLAGDFRPHQESPAFTNLKGALWPLYLGPLEPADATALILMPVDGRLSFEGEAIQRILELTGGKPGLIQLLCDHLYASVIPGDSGQSHITQVEFDRLWESGLRGKVFESFGAVLKDCFEGLQDEERSIFALLAQYPLAPEDQIADMLNMHPALVRGRLQSLQVTHRVECIGTGYYIGARLVEEYGRQFIAGPIAQVSEETDVTGTNDEQRYFFLRTSVWVSIGAVERRLRRLITEAYEQKVGPSVEATLLKRHPEFHAEWSENREKNKGSFKRYEVTSQGEESLLNYSYIGELGQVIGMDWEFFRESLNFGKSNPKQNKLYWTEMMEAIAPVRNELAHQRDVPQNELKRIQVYCNDIARALGMSIRP